MTHLINGIENTFEKVNFDIKNIMNASSILYKIKEESSFNEMHNTIHFIIQKEILKSTLGKFNKN